MAADTTPGLEAILAALAHPAAYPHPAAKIGLVQTHASAVLLAGEHVYKLKKPVDFGFLDYSTLERRERMCRAEVDLNRRLAPDVYLGVVPITLDGRRIALGGKGQVIEHAVHMRRLPEERTLAALVQREPLEPALLEAIGALLADFHAAARRGPDVARWAAFERVRENCADNVTALEARAEQVAPRAELVRLGLCVDAELEARRALIERRAARGIPCDTHGDLRLEHVYALEDGRILVVDCIEFSDRFRCADPVADIAFLTMDLAAHGAWQASARLADAWFARSGDEEGRALMPLYSAYRSTVRAKVRALQAEAKGIPERDRARALQLARAHVQLAVGELAQPADRPCLVLVAGLPGTGKSVLAGGLAREARFEWLRADAIRKELAGLDPLASGKAGVRAGIYTPAWNERTYGECLSRARELLFAGRRVLVDASFKEESRRQSFLDAARDWGVPARVLVCTAPPPIVRERLADRRDDPSDADWPIYEHVQRTWEPFDWRTSEVLDEIDTSGPVEVSLRRALERLAAARLR